MKKLNMKKLIAKSIILIIVLAGYLIGINGNDVNENNENTVVENNDNIAITIIEDGNYTSVDEVGEYIHIYGKLPGNYITKNEAKDMGRKIENGTNAI
jgi:RNase P/RNase MRP subunit p29